VALCRRRAPAIFPSIKARTGIMASRVQSRGGWRDAVRDGLAETAVIAARAAEAETAKSAKTEIWLPFLDTYRTMCLAPNPEFRQLLEQARDLPTAA